MSLRNGDRARAHKKWTASVHRRAKNRQIRKTISLPGPKTVDLKS